MTNERAYLLVMEQEDLFLQLMQLALENVENHAISSGEGMLPPEIL